MKKAILLAPRGSTLDEVRVAVEAAFKFSLSAHESAYHGGDYFRGEIDEISFLLQANFVEDDGEVTEAEFPDADFLLYVNGGAAGVDEIFEKLKTLGKILRLSEY